MSWMPSLKRETKSSVQATSQVDGASATPSSTSEVRRMGVDEGREFTNKFCQLSCQCQTWIRVNESGEFTYEFC